MPIALTQIRQVHPPLCLRSIVDQTVKSIGRTYDEFGRVDTVTSYANDNGTGTIRNQVDYDFNTYSKVSSTWQSHEGAVVKAGAPTPKMSYTYDTSATSNILTAALRPHFTDYPDGRRFRDYYGNQSLATFNRFQRVTKPDTQPGCNPGGPNWPQNPLALNDCRFFPIFC